MSHFTVLVVLPKDGLEKLEGRNFEGKEEWQNAYDHQWYHPLLEQALEPYNENPDNEGDYVERNEEYNEFASKVMSSYKKEMWDILSEEISQAKLRAEMWARQSTVFDVSGGRKYTESEIATKLEPIDKLYELMASNQFDINNEEDEQLFKDVLCNSDEIFIDDKTHEVYDVWYSNPQAKWDWWVVGGRWRNMGDNGVFTDLSEFSKVKKIPYWKEELGYKLHDIEKELGIDVTLISDEEYDELITDYIASGNPIVRFYDRDTREPAEYYDKKDLLTMVERREQTCWAYLFPEEGWIEASEMGWWGMSSLDSMDLKETEQVVSDQFALTDNYLAKYKDTHIGIVVDCHI